jgi:hypothetical protein
MEVNEHDLGDVSEHDLGDEEPRDEGLRERLSRRGEEAIGDVAQALLENPILNSALSTALGAGERAMQAQRSAMDALNLPAASDIERLERRVRSISDRLEEIEDRVDDLAADVAALRRSSAKTAG